MRMKAPQGVTSASIGSAIFVVEGGFVDVDPAHVKALIVHGFVVDEESPEDQSVRRGRPAKEK